MNNLTTEAASLITLKKEFISSSRKMSRRVLSCIVINRVINTLRLPNNDATACIAGIIIILSTWILGYIINKVTNSSISLFEMKGMIPGSVLTGLAYWIIRFLHDITLKVNRTNIADLSLTKEGLLQTKIWFDKSFSLKSQLKCSTAVAICGLSTIIFLVDDISRSKAKFGIYFTLLSGMFAIGNGVYCCLKCPTLTTSLTQYPLKLYPLDPANTVSIREFALIFGRLSLGCGLITTILMAMMSLARPWEDKMKIILGLSWLIAGWGAVTYCFLYPFQTLSKEIQKEKHKQLKKLEYLISYRIKQSEQYSFTKDDFEHFKKLIELRETVQKVRETPIDLVNLRNYITSLTLPLISFLISNKNIIGKLLKISFALTANVVMRLALVI